VTISTGFETIAQTAIGRIVVPPFVPDGFAVMYTTRDFRGSLDAATGEQISGVIRDHFGVDAILATCTQIHGVAVRKARRETSWTECHTCDALWTDEKNVALGIKVADCLPVSIIEPGRGVIANIHSGWRGAAKGITGLTVDAIPHEDAWAYLGPSIRVCCFEVGEEVAVRFEASYVDRSYAKPHVDLVTMTVDVLRNRGFAPEKIFDSGLCTRCEGSIFHSFRGNPKGGGRNLAIVAS
jgi:YfiH family protein